MNYYINAMEKSKKVINTLLFILSTTVLSSCGFTMKKDFSDYVENEFCRTNVNSITNTGYAQVGQVKMVQPYRMEEDGSLTTAGVTPTYPFDTNLIYTLYASKDLNSSSDISTIEDATGEYIFKTHKLFDRHNYYIDENGDLMNNLRVLNESYGKDWISVDKELFNVLKEAVEITKVSEGKFNLFIGELSSFWNNYINNINVGVDFPNDTVDPDHNESSKNELKKLVENTPLYNEVDDVLSFDENGLKVKFNKYKNAEKVSISLGGIGKGYLCENLYQKLKNIGKTNGAIYAGSSSILVMDKQAYGHSWSLGLSNPYGYYYSPVGNIKFNEKMSVSTSGAQINYYYTMVDGKLVLRHHIIDAATGYPNTEGFDQISIISKGLPSSLMDSLSTVLINCKEDEIEHSIKTIREYYDADLECVLYKKSDDNNEAKVHVSLTKGFKKNETFIEHQHDGSAFSIKCEYTYLDY